MNYSNEQIKKLKRAFAAHKSGCKGRIDRTGQPINFHLTFDEWMTIWHDSGHLLERGRRKGQYCMSRIDDLGNYEVGNVVIQLHSDNVTDGFKHTPIRNSGPSKFKGVPRSLEVRKKIGDAQRGKPRKPHTKEHKEHISRIQTGRKFEIVECPHCSKTGGESAMKRWHFSNCKMK